MYLLKSRWDIEIYFATLKKKKQNALHFKMHPKKKNVCTLFSCWQLWYNQVYKNTSQIPI